MQSAKVKTTKTPKVLVLNNDSDETRALIAIAAEIKGFHHTVTFDPETFMDKVDSETTLILMELIMPQADGIELMRLLAYRKCRASLVLMSSIGRRILESAEEVAKALGLSVVGHLEKPFCLEELNKLFEQHLRSETEPVCKSPKSILFQDAELRNAIERDEFVLHY